MHRSEAFAIIERIIANACYAVRNFNAGEAGATVECIITYAGYAIRDFNACETCATPEYIGTNCIAFAIVIGR